MKALTMLAFLTAWPVMAISGPTVDELRMAVAEKEKNGK
jgi:hypothetical protein